MHASVLRIVQQQMGELGPLLHQMNPGQSRDTLLESGEAEQVAQDDPRIVEAEGLVEVACQQVSLHRWRLIIVQVAENSTPPAGTAPEGAVGTSSCHPGGRLAP